MFGYFLRLNSSHESNFGHYQFSPSVILEIDETSLTATLLGQETISV